MQKSLKNIKQIKNYSTCNPDESALIVKCRQAPAEHASEFDATDTSLFCYSPATERGIAAHCCSSCTHVTAGDVNVSPTEEPNVSHPSCGPSEEFSDFCCYSTSEPVALLEPVGAVPIYRALCRPGCVRSSPCAGGGDAFDESFFPSEPFQFAGVSLQRHYEDIAIVDSGASSHHFGDTAHVQKRRPANLFTTLADGSRTHIDTKGDVVLPSEDSQGNPLEPLILKDVSILKGSPINLVSISMLCDEGASFRFSKGNSYFDYKGRRHRLIERDGLYILRLDEVLPAEDLAWLRDCEHSLGHHRDSEVQSPNGTSYACAASYDLWHERFGHASKKRLKFLFDSGSCEGMAVSGAPFKHDRKCTCPTCLSVNNAKRHIGDVREYADTITRKGQLLYTDICGPFPPSVEGYRYVISFTDVYSRFSTCYMLRKKSDSEAALRALISYYARYGILIKEIRSDQGGEFGGANHSPSISGGADTLRDDDSLNFFFKRVCDEHNITHVPTPAYRPELHGLAERWNLTTMKLANAMLFSARLSHLLWPSAVAHANLLRNRLPVRGLGKYTPYELFFGERPRVDQLRVFGCDCYKLLPTYPKLPGQQARKRLIYCGETADRIGFRVFDPITYKFSTEFDLVFDEGSARKRINALYEHDVRRELSKQGKLRSLPLVSDDFTHYDASQKAVRDVFSSPQPP